MIIRNIIFSFSLIYIICLLFPLSVYAQLIEPANPNSSQETKQVLNWLKSLPQRSNNRVMPGQFIGLAGGTSSTYNIYIEELYRQTGHRPPLVGVDWGIYQDAALFAESTGTLINHWNNNGLVTISFHANNPWTGGLYTDRAGRNLTELITPGTSVNGVWMNELDKISYGLQILEDAGVVVFWRPFHEMTWLNSFWWTQSSLSEDTQPFINMWRHMFDYFTYEKGLNNLLWVYSTADYHDGVPATHLWPGDDYVDVVGISLYSDPDSYGNIKLMRGEEGYPTLLATGKPFAFTEYGPHPPPYDNPLNNLYTINSIRDNYPQAIWFYHWNDYLGDVSIKAYSNASALFNDSWTLSQGELDWGGVPLPTIPPAPTNTPTPTLAPVTPTATPTPNPLEIIIDNNDANFSSSATQDDWQVFDYLGGQHYKDSHFFNTQIGGADTATWTFDVQQPGYYQVFAWWWDGTHRPSDVPYTISHQYGSSTQYVNQQINGGQWNFLGIFNFESGGSISISDNVSSGQDVVADAIRLVYVGSISPTEPPTSSPVPGDADGDGDVDEEDYLIWLTHYNQPTFDGPSQGDFNENNFVDGVDFIIWLTNN